MESNTLILCCKELFLLAEEQEAVGLGTSDKKLLCHFLRKNHSVSFSTGSLLTRRHMITETEQQDRDVLVNIYRTRR